MRLKRYRIHGYKNLTAPVELDALGPINVLHGDNNVGKSNVLQSMEWLFELLGSGMKAREVTNDVAFELPIVSGSTYGKRFEEEQVFNLRSPIPVVWEVALEIESADLSAMGVHPPEAFEVCLRATLVKQSATYMFSASFGDPHPVPSPLLDTLPAVVARGFSRSTDRRAAAFSLVDTWRRTRSDAGEADSPRGDMVPQSQIVGLFDAREAFEPHLRAPWDSFQRAMESLAETLDGGRIIVSYERQTQRARMLWERGDTRIPVSLLGSGFQQVIALVARLANTNAPLVAIEEPELNLRYTLQLTLRDVLKALVGGERGVRQLFVTSHSPAFETGDHFYWMAVGPHGPTVTRRSVSVAAEATAMQALLQVPEGRAPTAYVTSEGLTRVPQSVSRALGLEGGGAVYFHRPAPDGPYQFLSEREFFALWPTETTESRS